MSASRVLAVLGHLWLLVAVAYSAAVPTQDTLIVSRHDGTTNKIVTDLNLATTSTPELTTEEQTPPIELTEMDVKSVISMRYAHTAVVAHVRNPAKRAQEAYFRVLLPETAFISGFVMTVDGESYKAYVKEKEEAKQIYRNAVSHGQGAAHIATKARDSNHFTVSVNVEPSSNAIFNLTYEELLVRRNDVYNCAINLHPGALVPKFKVTVDIKESTNISELRVPEIRTGNEIDATKNDAQMSNVIIEREGRSAVITFSPDLEEQKRLMGIYTEKSKESAYGKVAGEGVLGQFVVQYDVDRSNEGEVLVNDGYFVHFLAPNLPPLSKYVVFVLDTSGSMMGTKIKQLKQAMQTILSQLNPGDFFNIVDFNSTVSIHSLTEADQGLPIQKRHYYYESQKELQLEEPSQATPENIEKARVIMSLLEAYGGTNIYNALDVAVDLINKYGKHSGKNKDNASYTSVSTAVTNQRTSIENKNEENKRDEIKNLEPMIIFLTDGDPTVGVTNTRTIINDITEKNYGENKSPIFTLAFGDYADRTFLRKLALRNDGFMRHIYEAADAPLQLQDFYKQVASPVLTAVKFIYPPYQVNENTTTKHKFRTFYTGSELVVAGRVAPAAKKLNFQVSGLCGVIDDGFFRRVYDKKVIVSVPTEKHENLPLERLWAYLTVKQALDEIDISDNDSNNYFENRPHKKALRLSLKYEFVTSLTSLVVVKPNATNTVNAESVDKQTSGNTIKIAKRVISRRRGSTSFASSSNSMHTSRALAYPAPGRGSTSFASSSNSMHTSRALAYPAPAYRLTTSVPANNTHSSVQTGSVSGFKSSGRGSTSFASSSNSMHTSRALAYPAPAYRLTTSVPANNTHSSVQTGSVSGFKSSGRGSTSFASSSNSMHTSRALAYPAPAYRLTTSVPANNTHSSVQTGSVSGYKSSALTPFWMSRTTFEPPKIQPASSSSSLDTYYLKDYGWTLSLLDASKDAIVLQTNKTVTLKLSRYSQVPKASIGDASCTNAVDGEGGDGFCVYLTRCFEARNITVDLYKTNYCVVDGGYAGVCCHKNKIDISTDDMPSQKRDKYVFNKCLMNKNINLPFFILKIPIVFIYTSIFKIAFG